MIEIAWNLWDLGGRVEVWVWWASGRNAFEACEARDAVCALGFEGVGGGLVAVTEGTVVGVGGAAVAVFDSCRREGGERGGC